MFAESHIYRLKARYKKAFVKLGDILWETEKKSCKSAEYLLLSEQFNQWLVLLGYSPLSTPALLLAVTDFLQYQEQQQKTILQQLEAVDANHFIQTTIGRGCGSGHVNKQIQALKLFSRYLRESGQSGIGFHLERMDGGRANPTWLTKQEIQSLYEVTGDSVLGIRDRAMLAVFYGCGLRLNEGTSLELKDIDRNNKRIHVRKGKHYKDASCHWPARTLQNSAFTWTTVGRSCYRTVIIVISLWMRTKAGQ
ncbi:tyrosine-type recombinase/integrase [Terrimonas ginsenosidimutans]|uniref:tyrosine-type recombinase/integrase n=1 Tax=Terrimonas ginsenosidimutans TaxID=2908004 RepID=UPI0021048113|nr:tyrosine-type recombinase/integrase [Terrimonas ginsenosidimutans]